MKNFTFNIETRFFNLATIVGALLFSVGIWAQPTVNVPQDCEVVVIGVGGSLGFGEKVGDGGIITMPDPDGGGEFSINVPTGYVITGWTLYGDISVDAFGIGSFNHAIQTVASGLTSINIITYNKNLREPSEDAPNDIIARSKGRIRIDYTEVANSCSGILTFDIYKTYTGYVPDIVGEKCWIPDVLYTYSVDQIASDNLSDGIGVDNYYWTVVDNDDNEITNFYTSADESAITIKAPNPLNSPYTIKVCFGRANGWDGDHDGPDGVCRTMTVGTEPEQPIVNIPACVPVSEVDFSASITSPDPSYTYTWTSSNGEWTPASTEGTSVTFETLGYGKGTVFLSVEGCSQSQFEYNVGRTLEEPINVITGEDDVDCLEAGEDYTFSISNASQLDITWDLPNGWFIHSEPPTNGNQSTINLHIPDTVTTGASYSLYAWSCYDNERISKTVYIRPSTPSINSPASTNVCIPKGDDTPLTFTATPAGSYTWDYPNTWTITSTDNTETITIEPDGVTTGEISATRVAGDNCESISSAVWNVNFSPVQPDTILPITCWSFGTGTPVEIIVNNAPNTPYFYGEYIVSSDPSGFIASSSSDEETGVITLTPEVNIPAGIYTLTITHEVDGCTPQSNINIPVDYQPTETVLGTPFIDLDDQYTNIGFDGYILKKVFPNQIVNWYIEDELQEDEHSIYFYINQNDYSIPTTICAEFIISGCTNKICIDVEDYQGLIIGGGSTSRSSLKSTSLNNIKVYPNPNDGDFTIEVLSVENEATMEMYDISGKLVNTSSLNQGNNKIKENFVPGTYILLFTIDGNKSGQKLQIKR